MGLLSLVILLEIDVGRIAVTEFEGDAPWAIDMDRVALGIEATERVKIETCQVQPFNISDRIQAIEPDNDAFMHPDIDLRGFPGRPKVAQRLAFECLDHAPNNVSYSLTKCQ
jgi:hypothetical protein